MLVWTPYYRERGRSVIPLYTIAYHIFYTNVLTEKLPNLFDDHDINNPDFLRIKRWLYLSVLNGVFSRGCRWIPIKRISKILRIMQSNKGQPFPIKTLFSAYIGHPIRFSEMLTVDRLGNWDGDFVFYLMYNRNPEVGRDIRSCTS
ncbi:MAG: hypothetical protein R3E31_27250 [Chloroflexota bacterium]